MDFKYLGTIGYKNKKPIQTFFVGTNSLYTEKKIVIFGAGDLGFYVLSILRNMHINVYGYSDNNTNIQNTMLNDIKILSPLKLFEEKEQYYFIVAVSPSRLNDIRWQLKVNCVEEYGIFFICDYHSFFTENYKLEKCVLESVKFCAIQNDNIEISFPLRSVGGNGSSSLSGQLGCLYYILVSTMWSHWSLLWLYNLIEELGRVDVCEIGPGYGFVSEVLLSGFTNTKMTWILYGPESMILENDNIYFSNVLRRIKKKHNDRIDIKYGYLEADSFCFDRKYDVILMTEVFEHFVANPIRTLQKIRSALTDDGYLILSTPAWGPLYIYNDWNDMPDVSGLTDKEYLQFDKYGGHVYQYTKKELDDIFDRSGFRIIKYEISDSNNHNYLLQKYL